MWEYPLSVHVSVLIRAVLPCTSYKCSHYMIFFVFPLKTEDSVIASVLNGRDTFTNNVSVCISERLHQNRSVSELIVFSYLITFSSRLPAEVKSRRGP